MLGHGNNPRSMSAIQLSDEALAPFGRAELASADARRLLDENDRLAAKRPGAARLHVRAGRRVPQAARAPADLRLYGCLELPFQVADPLLDQDPMPFPFDKGLLQKQHKPLGLPGIVAAGLQVLKQ